MQVSKLKDSWNNDSYTPYRWHTTLLVIAIVTFSQLFNTFAHQPPIVEAVILILHIFGFFAILIPLWVMGQRGNAHDVFFTFTDGGNWGSTGLSCLVGLLSQIPQHTCPRSYEMHLTRYPEL